MYEQGVDEQLICEKNGHHSVAVRSYKRTSNKQLKHVSDILNGVTEGPDAKVAKKEETSTVSKPPDSVKVEESIEKCNETETTLEY